MAPRRVSIGSLSEELDRAGVFDDAPESPSLGRAHPRRPGWPVGWMKRAGLAIVGVGLATIVLVAVLVRVLVDPADVTSWLTPRVADALNREVTLGGADLAIFPRPGLVVTDVRIGNPVGREGPPLAGFDRVHLDVALAPLLTGRVDVRRIRLSGARLDLTVESDGSSNFGDWVPTRSGTVVERRAPVRLALRRVSVSDGRITFFDGANDRSFAVTGIDATADLSATADGGWDARVTGASDSLHVRAVRMSERIARVEGPVFDLAATGDRSFDNVAIEEGSLRLADHEIAVSGTLGRLTSEQPSVELLLANPALDAGVLTALVSSETRSRRLPLAEGELDVALRLRGALGSREGPHLEGRVRLADVGLRLAGVSVLEALRGDIVIFADTVRADSVVGTFARGPLRVDGWVDMATRRFAGTMEASPDLDVLDRVDMAPEDMTIAGEARLSLMLRGPIDSIGAVLGSGRVRVTGVQAEHRRLGVPLYVPVGELEIADTDLSWSDVTLLVGEEPLYVSGSLQDGLAWLGGTATPVLEATVHGTRLDLGEVLPATAEPRPPYGHIAFAHLGGREVDGLRPVTAMERAGLSRPESAPVLGSVALTFDELDYRGLHLGAVTAKVGVSDSVLVVDDAAFDLWGGRVEGSLRLGVGDRLDEPFEMSLRATGVDARAFLARTTPIGDAIGGGLDLELDVSGTTDPRLLPLLESLEVTGRVELSEGVLEGTPVNLALVDFLSAEDWSRVPFEAWTTDFDVREGMIEVRESLLTGPIGSAAFSGAVGLGGAVDLAMGLSIPADRLEDVSLRRTGVAQSVLDRLRSTDSPLELGIRVSGTLEGPSLEPDALAATERTASRRR